MKMVTKPRCLVQSKNSCGTRNINLLGSNEKGCDIGIASFAISLMTKPWVYSHYKPLQKFCHPTPLVSAILDPPSTNRITIEFFFRMEKVRMSMFVVRYKPDRCHHCRAGKPGFCWKKNMKKHHRNTMENHGKTLMN